MSQAIRDENAANAIKAAVLKLFGSAIDEIEVRSGDDHNDRPAFFVTVFMKAEQQRMSSSQWLDTIAASASALREIDDDRFPYVTFLAPEDQSAEDTRPAA
jgi:hypothetical protein